jgi:hypothetical protein
MVRAARVSRILRFMVVDTVVIPLMPTIRLSS